MKIKFIRKVVVAGTKVRPYQTSNASPCLISSRPLEATMKKTLLICAALLAVCVSSAMAAGVNLGWDDCAGLGGAPGNKFGTATFSCNSNLNSVGRSSKIVGTYVLANSIDNLVANEVVLDMMTPGGVLAPWWDFGNYPAAATPGCRAGQLVFAFRDASTSCLDWPGTAGVSGNMTVERDFGGPGRARIKLIGAYTAGAPQPVVAGDEMVSFTLTINNAKTVGTPNCVGCASPMCMVLNSIIVNQAPVANPQIKLENPQDRNYVTWNDAANTTGCPGVTPTHRNSWGQVKSLYRN